MKFLLLVGLLATTQATQPTPSKPRTGTVAVKVEPLPLVAPAAPTAARGDSLYIAFLEKTNQQLGLWTNPYGLMVATLGALFTIAGIGAAVLLYRQSSDFRKQYDAQLAALGKKHEEMIADNRRLVDALVSETKLKTDLVLDDVNERLDKATTEMTAATGAEKEKLREDVARLERLAAQLTLNTLSLSRPVSGSASPAIDLLRAQMQGNVPPQGSLLSHFLQQARHQCRSCGANFPVAGGLLGRVAIQCPYCGYVENNTGPTGPTGPGDPSGPTGPVGPTEG